MMLNNTRDLYGRDDSRSGGNRARIVRPDAEHDAGLGTSAMAMKTRTLPAIAKHKTSGTSGTATVLACTNPPKSALASTTSSATMATTAMTATATAPARQVRICTVPVDAKGAPSASKSKRRKHGEERRASRSAERGTCAAQPEPNAAAGSGPATNGRVCSCATSAGKCKRSLENYLGLVGWRKRCLYALLTFVVILTATNLALLIWIIRVMDFSWDSMGPLKILPNGVQLNGQAIIMGVLRTSSIRSRHGQPIVIESSRNFTINTRSANGTLENRLFLGHDRLECLTSSFRVNDTNGRSLFYVDRNEVRIGAHTLRVDGDGGTVFHGSVQTSHIRAEAGKDLRLESPTRELKVEAGKGITLLTRTGSIELNALRDIEFNAVDGNIHLDSSKILMPNLRTVQPAPPGATPSHDHQHRVYQLCACANGKLFMAAPHTVCAVDSTEFCR